MQEIFIKTPEELEKCIEKYENADEPTQIQIVFAIGSYKWYNFYCNLHIKLGSEADKKNRILFENLEKDNEKLHKLAENIVDGYIIKLKYDADD